MFPQKGAAKMSCNASNLTGFSIIDAHETLVVGANS